MQSPKSFVIQQIGPLIPTPSQSSSSEIFLHVLLSAGTTGPQDTKGIRTEDTGQSMFCF